MTQHLTGYLETSAARWPDRPAVIDAEGRQLTFAELNTRADVLAAHLASRGVSRGDRVGIVLPKSLAAVVSLFGVMKAGAAYVPVDPLGPVDRGRRILTDCDVRAVILHASLTDVAPDPAELSQGLASVLVVGECAQRQIAGVTPTAFEHLDDNRAAVAGIVKRAKDLAYIIYTSGSTGIPKGVMITHANALSFVEWCSELLDITPEDRLSGYSPFHFDASVIDIYTAIRNGAALCLVSEDLAKAPRELAAFIARTGLTIWTSTPSAMIMLLEFGQLSRHDMSRIRAVNFGGEVFPIKHLRALQREWSSAVYYNMYGPTETTTTCTYARIPSVIPESRQTPYPIGFACPYCRAIALSEDGQEVAAGEEGLLHISGPSVFAGYWRKPAETDAVMTTYDGARWYNTGDVVRWDPADGFTFIGRRDGMIKRRGFRIELGEIERALLAHANISEAAAVAWSGSEGGVEIAVFVVCRGGQTPPSMIELKTFCAGALPAYMVPDRFVFETCLPRTSSDKIDYQTLKASVRQAGAA